MNKNYLFTTAEVSKLMNTHDFKQVMIYTENGLVNIPDTYIDRAGTMILSRQPNFLHAHKHETCWALTHIKYDKAINNTGYKLIGFNGHAYTLHRVMASTWVEKPEGKNDINHKDLNKFNNSASNLEWCTKSENMRHYHQHKGDK